MSSQTNNNEATTGDRIKTTYKEQLDKAAEKVKGPPAGTKEEPSETLLDKVTEYVPAVGKLLGKEDKKDEQPVEPAKPSGPPHRPVHDTQIEEFVRDQHRSQDINGVME
ncbi:hypothetical protein CONLIGDRAFT_631864 [Coniochaeta ligniaria NRRL 30616]|uniref:Uncharacterized protein n=1 Tax=Coniochaeta ligniaria NRRL 30616 TaxID=1408157 RepID=A0A1J7IRF4_9PEZI|nr:hypothetical protein CONLIGDRAFT_631864 [Coniochaeta ligniaria NRRL 30616]